MRHADKKDHSWIFSSQDPGIIAWRDEQMIASNAIEGLESDAEIDAWDHALERAGVPVEKRLEMFIDMMKDRAKHPSAAQIPEGKEFLPLQIFKMSRNSIETAIYDALFFPGPEPRVAINKLGIRDGRLLEKAEAHAVRYRIKQGLPIEARQLTYAGFKAIYHHLF